VRSRRRRHISADAGHALEILGHAIEYLTDEYVHEGGTFSGKDPRLEAVQIMMACNRRIYFACPEAPGVLERMKGWLQGLWRKKTHRDPGLV
jgi:hypothetical protein